MSLDIAFRSFSFSSNLLWCWSFSRRFTYVTNLFIQILSVRSHSEILAHLKGFRLQSLLYHLPKTPLLFFPWQTTSYTPISSDVENWMTTLMESQYQIFLGSRTQTMPASATTPILLWKTLSLTLCQCPSLAHPGTNVNEKQWEWVCC